jgi:hypothetical protein
MFCLLFFLFFFFFSLLFLFLYFFFFLFFFLQQAQTERKRCKTSASSVRNGNQTQHALQRKFCFAQHHQSLNVWFETFVPLRGPRAHPQSLLNSRIVLQRAWSAVRLPPPHFTFFVFHFHRQHHHHLSLVAYPRCLPSLLILVGNSRWSSSLLQHTSHLSSPSLSRPS